jgi:hypothetical protein
LAKRLDILRRLGELVVKRQKEEMTIDYGEPSMQPFRRFTKPITYVVVTGLIAVGVPLPAQAALVTTDVLVSAQQAEMDRGRVQNMLDREDVKQQLLAHGVDPQQAIERVAALSDQEVHRLSKKMDEMPAGGDAIGALVFVFLVLLVTDLLGLTDVFPFVKKPVRR